MDSTVHAQLAVATLLYVVKFVNVACFSALVVDYAQTFRQEIAKIWPREIGVRKILFFWARYSALFDLSLSLYWYLAHNSVVSTCRGIFIMMNISILIAYAVGQGVLVVQTWVLYKKNMKMLTFLAILQNLQGPAVITGVTKFLISAEYGPPPFPVTFGCGLTKATKILLINSSLMVFNESILLVLALYAAIQRHREFEPKKPLLLYLHEQGIPFFAYMLSAAIGHLVILIHAPIPMSDLLVSVVRFCHSAFPCRILLQDEPDFSDSQKRASQEVAVSWDMSNALSPAATKV